jgi:hypothetical protein
MTVRTQNSVGEIEQRRRNVVGLGQVQRHQRAVRMHGAGSIQGRLDLKVRPFARDITLPPERSTESDGLDETVGRGEGRHQAPDAPTSRDQVEAREVSSEQGRVPSVLGGLQPSADQDLRDHRAEAGGEDDGVAQRSLVHEQGAHALGLGSHRLFSQTGEIVCLEEATFHGDADYDASRGSLGSALRTSDVLPPPSNVPCQAGLGQTFERAAQRRQLEARRPGQVVEAGGIG